MTIKAEHLKSKEQFDEMTAFLTKALDDTYVINVNLMYLMWAANALYFFVKRTENKDIEGLQIWLSVHDPLHGGKHLCKKLAEAGITTGFESAKETAFSVFDHGYTVI